MKIAIVTEWLSVYAGAEKVLEQIIKCFPEADLFAVCDFIDSNDRNFLANKDIKTTFIQKLPFAKKYYRNYLPLMPLAIEQLDLSAYDLVISSSHAVAKGVLTGPNQLHISYVHTPIRYAWDLQHQYLKESKLESGIRGLLAKWFLHKIRLWDYRTANGVDFFVCNSTFIKKRIKKVYGRESVVIYPPVAIHDFTASFDKGDYYITVSRMVPYKKIDLIVEAFSQMPDKKLVVVGTGPDAEKIKKLATANIQLLSYQPTDNLKPLLQGAKAFVFAAEEDFGVSVVEAQACGTPVIAYGKGGSLETVRSIDSNKATGIFFSEQTVTSLIESVNFFEENRSIFTVDNCRDNALRFSEEIFRSKFREYVMNRWSEFYFA